ncbi:hypothetical protein L1987_70461 [Smallanthus sonchifolius]|uniref:Uncharacterized protein n=1 Tax=Smallanthus sonchifolius TaxID=185202 RepID=A0ACB9APX8_9ASTR|nr:hypothetical protein L1987_70461 [Smallanthus sonchifolius]
MANTCTCDRRYVAPEYTSFANMSTKADVYSLGVLVLETITGTPEFMFPLKYVERKWLDGTLSDIIDPRIDIDSSSITRFFEIGLLCVQKLAKDRPTMEEVVGMLLGSLSHSLPVSKMRARVTGECSNSVDPLIRYINGCNPLRG